LISKNILANYGLRKLGVFNFSNIKTSFRKKKKKLKKKKKGGDKGGKERKKKRWEGGGLGKGLEFW